MNYVNTFKKVLLAAGIILLMPMVLSASVFAERRQVEGYGSYFLMFSEIEDEALAKERARYEALLNASDKAAVFVDSSTDMAYGRLTRSEIRSYAPSVLRVQGLPQYTKTSQGNGTLFNCRLVAMVDTSDFKNISYESLQKSRRQEGERELLIREMDDLKYKYAHAYSDAERQNIRFRMKQLIDQFMRNRTTPVATTYDTAMAKLAYNDAVDYDDNKDYSNAIALYQKAISYDPRYYRAYNNLGIIYKDVLLDYDKARECFETAVQINPAYDYSYCCLGNLYRDAYKDYDETDFDDSVDTYDDRVYKRANELFRGMLDDGSFVKDDKACYYIYELTMDGRVVLSMKKWGKGPGQFRIFAKQKNSTRMTKESMSITIG